jgi:hypothetical protein
MLYAKVIVVYYRVTGMDVKIGSFTQNSNVNL